MTGTVEEVVRRLTRNTSQCTMELYDLLDAEGQGEKVKARDYYRVFAKIHDPVCTLMDQIKKQAFAHTMQGNDNPLDGVAEEVGEELQQSFLIILRDELEEKEGR